KREAVEPNHSFFRRFGRIARIGTIYGAIQRRRNGHASYKKENRLARKTKLYLIGSDFDIRFRHLQENMALEPRNRTSRPPLLCDGKIPKQYPKQKINKTFNNFIPGLLERSLRKKRLFSVINHEHGRTKRKPRH